MGLFDKLKNAAKGAVNSVNQATQPPPPQQLPPQQYQEPVHEDHDTSHDHGSHFDVAGFDPANDEETFFNAVLHMESEGQFGGTDESRAEIMSRFGIHDRSHWQTVKDSCYGILVQKYGSGDEVGQREMNWRMGQMQQQQQQQVQKMAAGGGFTPVEGISLEAWGAMNAAIVGGANWEDVIKGAGIDKPRWDRINAEWNARMARDTTFAIAQVYGAAFQAASQGKYNQYAKEAAAARAANRELSMQAPLTWDQFFDLVFEQKYAAAAGQDPVATLKSQGLTIVDWTDVSTFMGYHIHRNGVRDHALLETASKGAEARAKAKFPSAGAIDADISF
ncbi:MAG TPA: hypothetical protein VGM39_01200 [Kofleriaceae bacterium]|jgi:hypothetical protein